jgi:RNA polymerase sigma factor (sigma-70 family)
MGQQADHEQRFAALYDSTFTRVYAYVRYRVSSDEDAEDLVAETFLRAARGFARFTPQHDGAAAAWLFRIAHNLTCNFYRQHSRRPGTVSLDALPNLPDNADQPEEVLMREEELSYLRRVIGTLAPRQQEIITLRFFGGLRNQEIAEILELDARTVAAYLSRGLAELQRRYSGPSAADGVAFFYADDVFPTSLAPGLRQSYGQPQGPAELPDELREVLLAFSRAAPEALPDFRRDLRAQALASAARPGIAAQLKGWLRKVVG